MEDSLVNESNVDELEKWVPRIGMEFDIIDDAWNFWLEYGGKMGFNVRKHWENTSKVDGQVTSKRFLCAKEGFRRSDKRDHKAKYPRAETRTGCKVRMAISLVKATGKYRIYDLVLNHNHDLHTPETSYLLSSQRKITEVQGIEIELADTFGIQPRAAHEFIGAHVGGTSSLGYTRRDHKNYLRSKRQRDMVYGEAGSLLRYFHLQTIENPSFQYSIQLDCEESITNIFWADAKMIMDYASFGDVLTFDTTFGTNNENRPFGVFVGLNHFRETIVFGAALLYDETIESFTWLFETFLATHDNKHPKTIFTDQDCAMGIAIEKVMPDVWHGLCTWHIKENATKHLASNGAEVLREFKACMYSIKNEAEFEETFNALRGKVKKANWLDYIYPFKKKWAECYMSNVFSLGIRSTQLSESFNADLKDYLKCNMDVMRFFKQFERVLDLKRQNEINNEFDSKERLPKIKMGKIPLLNQAAKLYTPQIFASFQDEYELSTAAYIKDPIEGQLSSEYRVAIFDFENDNSTDVEYQVIGDVSTQTVFCSCKMYERLGILCAHALKVLDVMNIKLIPEKYILKRWTREARSEVVQDKFGRIVLDDPRLEATRRYRDLCRKFLKIACHAYNFEEVSSLIDNGLDTIINQVNKKLSSIKLEQRSQDTFDVPDLNAQVQPHGEEGNILSKVTLKKKEAKRTSKRRKSWTEKFHENRNVQTRSSQPGETKQKRKKKSLSQQNKENQPPVHVEDQEITRQHHIADDDECQNPEYHCESFTQLLLGEHSEIPYQFDDYFAKEHQNLSQNVDDGILGHNTRTLLSESSHVNWLGL